MVRIQPRHLVCSTNCSKNSSGSPGRSVWAERKLAKERGGFAIKTVWIAWASVWRCPQYAGTSVRAFASMACSRQGNAPFLRKPAVRNHPVHEVVRDLAHGTATSPGAASASDADPAGGAATVLGSMTTPQNPLVVLDGRLDDDKLTELLAIQAEHPELDFKSKLDLRATASQVELAKDVGAMQVLGAYIVIGAGEDGRLTGEIIDPSGSASYVATT